MWTDYLLFLLKTVTLVIAVLFLAAALVGMAGRARQREEGQFVVRYLNERVRERIEGLGKAMDKARDKARKPSDLRERIVRLIGAARPKKGKDAHSRSPDQANTHQSMHVAPSESVTDVSSRATEDATPREDAPVSRTFLLRFSGDIEASAVASLREEVTALLRMADPRRDGVLVALESPGGLVTSYGLAAAQLVRLRNAGIQVTVVVDKVAASGGYMMAAVANRVVAAPFAIVGSIGVVATVPNINRLLKRNDIDVEQHTSGKFKRTLSLLGENTDEGRNKFRLELEEAHQLFKGFLKEFRPELDLEKLATGEHWFGEQALDLGLVDALGTSDEAILQAIADGDVFEIRYQRKKRPLLARLNLAARNALFRQEPF